jgi:hypothetical protein
MEFFLCKHCFIEFIYEREVYRNLKKERFYVVLICVQHIVILCNCVNIIGDHDFSKHFMKFL